jgi:hypothetical protein
MSLEEILKYGINIAFTQDTRTKIKNTPVTVVIAFVLLC